MAQQEIILARRHKEHKEDKKNKKEFLPQKARKDTKKRENALP